jgi:uncharacterized protein Veg
VLLGLVPDESPTFEQLAQLKTAHTNVLRAIELHENCGGKKDLERAARLLKKYAPATTEA